MDVTLEKLVSCKMNVEDRLYEIQDELSERTFLECFVNIQERLRLYGYNNLANQFLMDLGGYHVYRMNNPFSKHYRNVRRGEHLGHMVLLGEDQDNSTKMVKCYDWFEGNTIHKRNN